MTDIAQREAALARLIELADLLTSYAHDRAWEAVAATQAEISDVERVLYAPKGE